ncbi:hypothetical protein ON010_g596 [Phytophthora cinnamomi]|nr:hypothetical protein ON010_g596 [Phytophthora cinnamomi]
MRRSYLLLLLAVVLATCGDVSASSDQSKPARSDDTGAKYVKTGRVLRSHEQIGDGFGDEERVLGSTLKKLIGLDSSGFSKRDVKKAIKNKEFKLDLYKKWDNLNVGEIQKKVKTDIFHPSEAKLLFDYLNMFRKSPASSVKVKRPQNAKNIRFSATKDVRTIDDKGNFVDKVMGLNVKVKA